MTDDGWRMTDRLNEWRLTTDDWRTDWPWLLVLRPPLLVITAWLEDGGDLPIKSYLSAIHNPACWTDSVQIWVAAKWLTIDPFLLLQSPILHSSISNLHSPFSIFLPSLRIRLLSTRQRRAWAARTRDTNLSISNLQFPVFNFQSWKDVIAAARSVHGSRFVGLVPKVQNVMMPMGWCDQVKFEGRDGVDCGGALAPH